MSHFIKISGMPLPGSADTLSFKIKYERTQGPTQDHPLSGLFDCTDFARDLHDHVSRLKQPWRSADRKRLEDHLQAEIQKQGISRGKYKLFKKAAATASHAASPDVLRLEGEVNHRQFPQHSARHLTWVVKLGVGPEHEKRAAFKRALNDDRLRQKIDARVRAGLRRSDALEVVNDAIKSLLEEKLSARNLPDVPARLALRRPGLLPDTRVVVGENTVLHPSSPGGSSEGPAATSNKNPARVRKYHDFPSEHNPPKADLLGYYKRFYGAALKLWVALAAVAAGFRSPGFRSDLLRNPIRTLTGALASRPQMDEHPLPGFGADFSSNPISTLTGALFFNSRMDEGSLQRAKQLVADTFRDYIPPDSAGFTASTEVTFDLPANQGGIYLPDQNTLRLRAHSPAFLGLHTAIHEFCHAYTSPSFYDALKATPNELDLGEALTEHIADKIPTYGQLSWLISPRDTAYDDVKLANGGNLVGAAKRIEDAVGEATLLRAYFGGDADAISAVSRAAVDIFPKVLTHATVSAVRTLGVGKYATCLDECARGASLLAAHSAERRLTLDPWSHHLLTQASRIREKIGAARFDQAFYNFDRAAAMEALESVRDEVFALWEPARAGARR